MRIIPKRKAKKPVKTKKGVLRIETTDLDDLDELDVIAIEEDDDEDEDTGDFVTEYLAKSGVKRKTAKIIELKGLDPEKVYGVECHKRGTFNVRQIRPANGQEINYHWRNTFDYGAVKYFPHVGVRPGFRLVRFPTGMFIAICSWPYDYIPQALRKRKIKFRKNKEQHEIIIKPKARIKFKSKRPRIRFRSAG